MPLPKVGDVIAGKYRIEGSLGEGGMAHVFAAHHTLLDKPVAVKILSPDAAITSFASFVERFLAEARAAAKVDSHHVARIMDVATLDDGLPYMVMERLEGCDLEALLARSRTSFRRSTPFARTCPRLCPASSPKRSSAIPRSVTRTPAPLRAPS